MGFNGLYLIEKVAWIPPLIIIFDSIRGFWRETEKILDLIRNQKVGGSTLGFYLSQLGMEVIDVGVPLLSMHSTYSVASKVDIYYLYLTCKAFLMSKWREDRHFIGFSEGKWQLVKISCAWVL